MKELSLIERLRLKTLDREVPGEIISRPDPDCQEAILVLNLRAARIQELEAQLAGKSETHCWVPREPTEEMVFACRGALQQHVASLSEAERRELPRAPWGYVFTPREKMLLRWRAMLAAAGEK